MKIQKLLWISEIFHSFFSKNQLQFPIKLTHINSILRRMITNTVTITPLAFHFWHRFTKKTIYANLKISKNYTFKYFWPLQRTRLRRCNSVFVNLYKYLQVRDRLNKSLMFRQELILIMMSAGQSIIWKPFWCFPFPFISTSIIWWSNGSFKNRKLE